MANDKEFSTNKEVQRSNEVQDRIDNSNKVVDAFKDLLESTTVSELKAAGYKQNEKYAGVYADGKKYGAGAETNQFTVKIAGRTKTSLQKEIILGTKSLVSVINFIVNDNTVTVEYKSPEAGFFRGVDADKKGYMVNEKITISMNNLKEEAKKLFTASAKKELGYLTSTKIGVDDKTEKSTTSMVQEITKDYTMKKLTIRELFSEDIDMNSDKLKDLNTIDLKDTTPPIPNAGKKKMFFDEDSIEEQETAEETTDKKDVQEITATGPAISGSEGGFKDGANSGSGGYNTKYAWKKTAYGKAQESKKNKPTVTKDWKVIPKKKEEEVEESTKDTGSKQGSSKKESEVTSKKEGGKTGGVVEPKSKPNFDSKTGNQNWKAENQNDAPASDKDSFWTEVDLEPGTGYIPKGMKQNYVAGMHDRAGELKKMGLAEGKQIIKENVEEVTINNNPSLDLTRKKIFSLNENLEKGVNKRYLITEKTTDEYEKERWKKLTSFKTRESIKEAEELTDLFESIKTETSEVSTPIYNKKSLLENVNHDDIFDTPIEKTTLNESITHENGEETINVAKPNSKFGLEYQFFKKDFLNENKKYILDLNSRVYVPNPNAK